MSLIMELFKRVLNTFGMIGSALSRNQSYLSDQIQCVMVGTSTPEDSVYNLICHKHHFLDHMSVVYTSYQLVPYANNVSCATTVMQMITKLT